MVTWARRATLACGAAVFLLSFAVYLVTLAPTVPFWDSGEFIAVSKILGVPHPPGTPFYVLIGRIASLIPIGSVAQRVNGLSALASAIAVLVTYLTTLRLLRLALAGSGGAPSQSSAPDPARERLAQFGALIGALMLAFSDNFWESATEAEVYAMMSLAQILVVWLGLKWWEEHERRPNAGLLLVCVYVMWVCVGLHLGVGLVGLPLLVLVWRVDRRVALLFAMPLLSALGVTYGLEWMAGIIMVLSVVVFAVYAGQKKLPWGVWLAAAAVAAFGAQPAFTDQPFTPGSALLAGASVLVPLGFLAARHREGRILALAFALMTVGYSTHLYLPIRAAQHPAINEGNPSSWERLRDLLERRQYGTNSPGGMLHRRGPWPAQLDKEFLRYWKRQWPLSPRPMPRGPAERLPEPRWPSYLLPLWLGLFGIVFLGRSPTSWLTVMTLFLLSTVAMILFLNFTDHEVRDRDYFFTTGYHVFAILIGIGATFVVRWVSESFEGVQKRAALGVSAALLAAQPVLLLNNLWYVHDRRGNWVAHDYAWNMLAPLAPNSYVFTNGDNDTFPLWYMQEVENFRRDVRVVNLSLLNTDWYIEQLRDTEPRLPMHLTDADIRALGSGYVADSTGRPLYYTNEFMVRHLVESSKQGPDGWIKKPYFAVTVPEHMGYDPYFSLEGLVNRIERDSLRASLDMAMTRHNLYEVFKYRGLFRPDGSWDPAVYKDENASTLSRNYAAAHLQMAFQHRRLGQLDGAIAEMERVSRMFPDYVEVLVYLGGFYLDRGDTARAVAFLGELAARAPGSADVRYYYGVALALAGQFEPAMREFDASIGLNPEYGQAYYAAFYATRERGQRERALGYLQRWVDGHPGDSQAAQLLELERGTTAGRGPALPPPVPNLP